ncbi:MAG: GNAT family N-acetyltransferase [Planctomycetota bacterium]|jgi:ribosomal-protein-alanine N-acetyltransferase
MDVLRRGNRVHLRKASPGDAGELDRRFDESRDLHEPWICKPDDVGAFLRIHENCLLVCENETDEITGYFNISMILRGLLQQAFLGFTAFRPFEGRGTMSEGLGLALDYAFTDLGLHRLEANVQPENLHSIRFVERNGFRREGFSPNYLKVGGAWRDHVRFALTVEDRME